MGGCRYKEGVDGVYQDNLVRDIKQGDGRRWVARFETDVAGMTGEISLKRKKTDSDSEALILVGALTAPDDNGDVLGLEFLLTDVQSASLELGSYHFGLRVKLDGITTTLIDQTINVSLSNPTEV